MILEAPRQYEVVFIVDAGADDAEVDRLTENHKQIVTDQGGVITKSESWGKRQLAYEILHKTEGTFVLMEIEGSGREIAELERRMRVNDRIIRYLTDTVIATVGIVKEEPVAEPVVEAEVPAEPEVIGKGKKEEEGAGDEGEKGERGKKE